MENPSHDEISTEWLETESERVRTAKALDDIRRDIAGVIERTTGAATYGETTNADEMSQYTPETDYDTGDDATRILSHRQITMPNRRTSATTVETEADETVRLVVDDEGNVDVQSVTHQPEGEREGTKSEANGETEPRTGREDQDGSAKSRPNKPILLRTRIIAGDAPDTVIIMLTAPSKTNERIPLRLRLLPAGAEADREEPVAIADVTAIRPSNLKVNSDGVHIAIDAIADQRIAMRVKASRPLSGKAYRIIA